MLTPPTPFPYVGSYALLVDLDAPPPQSNELVRILARRAQADQAFAMVAFPLRDGAAGNKVVPESELIDATPLSDAEARELRDLDRSLFGRAPRNLSKKQRAKAARRNALRWRTIHAPVLERLLRRARGRTERRAA